MIVMASIAKARLDRRVARLHVALVVTLSAMPFVSQFSKRTQVADSERIFERFIERHERDIFGYLWRMTGDEQAAYDLSQETFLRAWRHFARVSAYEQPRAWLFRVATHLAFNFRRGQRSDINLVELAEIEETLGTSDPAAHVAERDAIEAALLLLPKRMRAALILRDVYGYRSDEIANVLKVSRAAAKMTISRARDQFRASFLQETDQ